MIVMKNLLFAAAILCSALSSKSQTATSSQTLTLQLQNNLDIFFAGGTPNGTSFTFSNSNDYASGLTNVAASHLQVRSNKAWTVTVAAASTHFSSSSGTPMPAGKLGIKLTSSSSFLPLSITPALLTSGSRGNGNFVVDYSANPGFSYDAGTYTIGVVYTATQQ